MKIENYKAADLKAAIEEKKKVLYQIEQIEMNLWTDKVDEAIKRTVDLHLALVMLSRMQMDKRLESKFDLLHENLQSKGLNVGVIRFEHKKTD